MRKLIIAGNWKMNKNVTEAKSLTEGLKSELGDIEDVDIVLCPGFTNLPEVAKVIKGTNIALGAQNLHWEDSGAYTGEISAVMLKSLGCQYVIIGHSERRAYFGETNKTVNKKLKAALLHNLLPIVCVGETLAERESEQTFKVVKDHIYGAFKGVSKQQLKRIAIAYEPVWAIGTGKTATADQAQEVHAFIRKLLRELYDETVASAIRIQYGGSVKADNASELLAKEDIDGALVGGASLKVDSFVKIIQEGRK